MNPGRRALTACAACAIAAGGATAIGASARAARRQATAPPARITVLPFPGTPDVSPQTQIDFPTVAPSQVAALTVTGSRSGVHRGRTSAGGAGHGTEFMPAQPFAAGEQVAVRAVIRKGEVISFGFTVAKPVPVAINAATTAAATGVVHSSRRAHANQASFTHSFHSEPWLHPPVVVVGNTDPDPGSGDILTDAHKSIQAGPLILDAQGRPLWFDPLPGGQAGFDVTVQNYRNRSYLTFWQGYVSNGVGSGQDVMLDHSYRVVKVLNAANGYKADLHEFAITPQGDALITIYSPVRADLSSVGGSRSGILLDSIVEEIDIATGRLVWEWHAYGHIHIAESYAGRAGTNPYDFFHINSVQLLSNGNFLVSARHTFAVYEINPTTGKIVWVLGGKHSTFRMGSGTNFAWQHDAQMQPNGDITVFDDGAGYAHTESQSRGLRIRVNTPTRHATLVHQYPHRPPVLSISEGNVQHLSNGDVFVGFGSTPVMSEYTSSGQQLFSASLVSPVQFYRAFRLAWTAQPPGSPYAAASPTGSGTIVYGSWDGATNIASWRLLAGPSPGALQPVASHGSNGFETGISTSSTQAYFAMQALNSAGRVLGTSAAVTR